MMKKHFQLLALVALVISAIGFNSCRKDKNDDDANGGDTATSYTVTFNANGATGTAPAPMTAKKDETVKLPTSEGMTAPADKPNFLGWDIDKAATTATFPAGLEITSEVDITLYAIWTAGSTAPSYTVTFDANGGDKAPAPIKVTQGEPVTLPAKGEMTAPADKPYFLGWDRDKDATTATSPAGSEFTPEADITLYAVWTNEAPMYTVTFDLNGGGGTAPSSSFVQSGDKVTMPGQGLMTAPADKHVFLGWDTD
ncbi:MAG: InlB B-repeat-containing protein, partial [Bacteroidales bacterium]